MAIFGERKYLTVSIAAGQSLSDAVDLGPFALVAIETDANWTMAAISFQWSSDGTTWVDPVNVAGVPVETASVAASKAVLLDPADFASFRWLKVRSGTASSPVAQSSDTTLTLVICSVV